MFFVVIKYPDEWLPESFEDTPPSGTVVYILPANESDIIEAVNAFNESELRNPKGLWAIPTLTVLKIGEQVDVTSILEYN